MIIALILAAGDSVRMGRPKALLPDPEGRPFVARLVWTCAAAGVPDVVIVTGAEHDAIVQAVSDDRPPVAPRFVRNPDPSRGPLSSLWAGLDAAAHPTPEAVLMALVDVPMVRPETVRAVIDAWRRLGAPVVRPAVGDRHGHPVLFDRWVFEELRQAPLAEGAKAVVHAHADRVVNVQVDDEGCVMDIDTPADYNAMVSRFH
ncbi:MAG: nucleotidyltransferase family protein [Acidobacteria bacterium]|nr:nucleotidyltransferase family protein [Acidobacteriota bacterium]